MAKIKNSVRLKILAIGFAWGRVLAHIRALLNESEDMLARFRKAVAVQEIKKT